MNAITRILAGLTDLSLGKRMLASGVIGLAVSAFGFGLEMLGGMGHFTPNSSVSAVGCVFNLHVLTVIYMVFSLDGVFPRWVPDWLVMIVIPAIFWALICLTILSCWRRLKNGRKKPFFL